MNILLLQTIKKIVKNIIYKFFLLYRFSYRDRAKERRLKYGESDPPPINKSRERFNREMEKQSQIVAYLNLFGFIIPK